MSDTGAIAVDSGTSVDDSLIVGDVAWSTPGNVTADDSSYATSSLSSGSPSSSYLQATYSGFSIGATDTIQGFEVVVKRKRGGSGSCIDRHAYLVINGVIQTTGTDQKNGSNWNSTDETITYGGATDVWGHSAPVGATINSLATGVAIGVDRLSTNPVPSLQYITIKVYYTVAGGTVASTLMMMGVGP